MTTRNTAGPRYFVETFGCQMNVNDSEKAAGLLESEGYSPAASASEADVVFVNTCAVRERAAEKLYHAVGRYRALKRNRPGLRIAVGGCVAQLDGARVFERAPGIDVMVGTHNLLRLPELLRRNEATGERLVDLDRKADAFEVEPDRVAHTSAVRAYVTIMEGCNHVCSFCVVPRTRGVEVCRPVDAIVAEVKSLLGRGYHEVMLLGQTVNAYEHAGVDFPALLRIVHDLDERLWRLRFTTSHPEHVDSRMADAFGSLPRLAPYMHLPVQSGSDAILSRMRRGYTAAEYLERLALLRSSRPEIALTADVIVGYPGETEDDFQATVDLVEAARLDGLFGLPLLAATRNHGDPRNRRRPGGREEASLPNPQRIAAAPAEDRESGAGWFHAGGPHGGGRARRRERADAAVSARTYGLGGRLRRRPRDN